MVSIDYVRRKIESKLKGLNIPIYERALNNLKGTYIIVRPLALVGTVEQNGIVNVNIYADNLLLKPNGINDNSQPNSKELSRVVDLVMPLIGDLEWSDNELVNIQQSSPFYEDTQSYINIRINYRKLNY